MSRAALDTPLFRHIDRRLSLPVRAVEGVHRESRVVWGPSELMVPALLGVAGLALLSHRSIRASVTWAAVVMAVSIGAATAIVRLWPSGLGTGQEAARVFGVLAFLWALCGSIVLARDGCAALSAPRRSGFVAVAFIVALLFGVVTAVIQSVVLVIRSICAVIDIVHGYPSDVIAGYGFSRHGLWSLCFLIGAVAAPLVTTRDRRLATCLLWVIVMSVGWVCLLIPALRPSLAGGFDRTVVTLVLLASLSGILVTAVALTRWLDRRALRSPFATVASDVIAPMGASDRLSWPGMPTSAAMLSLLIIVLTSYHLIVPIHVRTGGFRMCSTVVIASAGLSSLACLMLYRRCGAAHLIESTLGLTAFAVCGVVTLAVPAQPSNLAARYPMIFNAMVVGFAVCSVLWAWLAGVERQRPKTRVGRGSSGALVAPLERFGFLCAALALLCSVVMAVWPRWPTVGAMDDTLGRVAAGLGGDLFLLLAMLWSSRHIRRIPLQVLTVFAAISAGAFLIVRMLPMSAQFG